MLRLPSAAEQVPVPLGRLRDRHAALPRAHIRAGFSLRTRHPPPLTALPAYERRASGAQKRLVCFYIFHTP